MNKGDYVEIAVNAIGDVASMVPIYGPFISTVKNVGINIVNAKQNNKIILFLEELKNRIEDIEDKFDKLKENDQFTTYFYKTIYNVRECFDENQFKLYLNYIIEYLNGNYDGEEMIILYDAISSINPYSWKLLNKLYEYKSNDWINTREFFISEENNDKNDRKGIDHGEVDLKVHLSLKNMLKVGILYEKHDLFVGDNSTEYIQDILINELGKKIIIMLHRD